MENKSFEETKIINQNKNLQQEIENSECKNESTEQIVTAYEVQAGDEGVDYDKLIKQFGCDKITEKQLGKIEILTRLKPHRFLRRGTILLIKKYNLLLFFNKK